VNSACKERKRESWSVTIFGQQEGGKQGKGEIEREDLFSE